MFCHNRNRRIFLETKSKPRIGTNFHELKHGRGRRTAHACLGFFRVFRANSWLGLLSRFIPASPFAARSGCWIYRPQIVSRTCKDLVHALHWLYLKYPDDPSIASKRMKAEYGGKHLERGIGIGLLLHRFRYRCRCPGARYPALD